MNGMLVACGWFAGFLDWGWKIGISIREGDGAKEVMRFGGRYRDNCGKDIGMV